MTETFNSYVFKILLLLLLLLFNWTILWSSETSDHLQEDLAKFIKPDYESRKFE
jgi:hypothetical protein